MKLILIILVFIAGLAYSGFKVWSYFDEQKHYPERIAALRVEEARKQAALHSPPPPVPVVAPVPLPDVGPVVAQPLLAETVVGNYRFKNRLVPEAPSFLRDEAKASMIVQKDEASNSWVWIGGPVLGSQILDLAKSYDVRQVEMDLEFVLVLMSTEKLRSHGVSLFYSEKASWLEFLTLSGDAGSLRISSGGWGAELGLQNNNTGISLLSQPVVRCVDGEPWKFATDSEVPVPRSEVVDGVIRQSLDFRTVGFGLSGIVRIVGDDILLKVEQRNGSIAPTTTETASAPTFSVQQLTTTLRLAWWEWSVMGGIQVDKEELRRGIFKSSVQSSSDYLVIFVRPRLSLEAPPKALPVAVKAGSREHPLLPVKGWNDFPDGIMPKSLPIPEK